MTIEAKDMGLTIEEILILHAKAAKEVLPGAQAMTFAGAAGMFAAAALHDEYKGVIGPSTAKALERLRALTKETLK